MIMLKESTNTEVYYSFFFASLMLDQNFPFPQLLLTVGMNPFKMFCLCWTPYIPFQEHLYRDLIGIKSMAHI